MSAPRVVVVGSCNIDLVARVERLPAPGATVLADAFETFVGGKGLNQAVAAARYGARCAMVAAVGDDGYAERVRAALGSDGIDTARVRTTPGPTGVALIAVDRGGENLIVVAPGANAALDSLTPEDLRLIGEADAVLFQLEIPLPTVAAAAKAARGLRVLNAAPARPLTPELLASIDVLVLNETEAASLAGTDDAASALGALVRDVPKVVITRGASEVLYGTREGERIAVRPPSVTAVDATAAGDTFTGVLATALAEGHDARTSLELACAASSLCIERRGASASIPTRAETLARRATAYPAARP